MQPIHAGYLANLMKGHKCQDDHPCPICFYGTGYHRLKAAIKDLSEYIDAMAWNDPEREAKVKEKIALEKDLPAVFYLMFVSKEFYTPETFVKEAREQGISKRVAANSLPKGFKVGKDWVFLGHGQTPFYAKGEDGQVLPNEKRSAAGIFYAFKPERLELVLWKGTDNDLIRDYEDAGYTVVLLEKTKENIERHGNGSPPPLPYGFKGKNKKKGSRDRGLSNESED